MKQPLVSIIMPAYNAEKYIKESIESVLNQTYKNWELIVINDGSIDNTKEIVESFDDERIILINQENKGVSAARNRGLKISKGEFITFLDADDILPPKSIESRAKYLIENSDIDIVDGVIILKDENMSNEIRKYVPYYKGELLLKLLELDDRVFFNVCYFFRNNKKLFFNEKMTHAEDLFFYIEMAKKFNVNYSFVNEEVYYYRVGNVSAMTNLDKLENGYIQLIKNVKQLNLPNKKMKIKIMKIMFLSFLNNKEYFKAFNSIMKIMRA